MGLILLFGVIVGAITSLIFCFFTERGVFYTAILFLIAVGFCLAMFLFVDPGWGWFMVALFPAVIPYSLGGIIGSVIGESLKKTTLGKLISGDNNTSIFGQIIRLMKGSTDLIIYQNTKSQKDKKDNKKGG